MITQELLNGGLVTARDATLLKPGELQQADNCIYRPFDPALYRAPGRTVFGAQAGAIGLAHLSFQRNPDLMLAYTGTAFRAAPFSAITGTFASLPLLTAVAGAVTDTLDTLHYLDTYFLLTTSVAPQRVAYLNGPAIVVPACTFSGQVITTTTARGFAGTVVGQTVTASAGSVTITTGVVSIVAANGLSVTITGTISGSGSFTTTVAAATSLTMRPMGMLPVPASSFPSTAAVFSSGSTWSPGTGYYAFLYTEMFLPGAPDDYASGFVESGFTGTPAVVNVTSATSATVTITRGTNIVNAGVATHWQVYMSGPASTSVVPDLSTFKRVGSPVPMLKGDGTSNLTYSLVETSATVSAYRVATAATTVSGAVGTFNTPTGALTPNDGSSAYSTTHDTAIALNTFGHNPGSGTVRGIKVRLTGFTTLRTRTLYIEIARHDSTKKSSAPRVVSFTTTGPFGANGSRSIELGGIDDLWGETWVFGDLQSSAGANFEVRCTLGNDNNSEQINLDGVETAIYYGGTTVVTTGVPFRAVTYTSQVGTTVSDSANLPPPIATTGDLFEGQLVVNDTSRGNYIVYSLPDGPEYFPKPYFMAFSSRKKDTVTLIRRVGQALIVAMQNSVKRVNYLPTESDADFQRGRAYEDIAVDHGCVGPMAGCTFDMPSQGPLLAYVSAKGLRCTNGVTTESLCDDLDWAATVDLNNISTCILRNYPKLYLLALYYAPYGGNGTNTKALYFHYSPDKLKGGLPALGPIDVKAAAAAEATLGSVPYLLTASPDGNVYVEDSGLVDIAALAGPPIVRTRAITPAGMDKAARNQRVFIRARAGSSTQSLTITTTAGNVTATVTAGSGMARGWYLYNDASADPAVTPGTILTLVSGATLTLSQPAQLTGSSVAIACQGTLAVTIRGANIHEAMAALTTVYCPIDKTTTYLVAPDTTKQTLEIQITQTVLPDGTYVDTASTMCIPYIAFDVFNAGPEVLTNVS